jgi:hypothetical protein
MDLALVLEHCSLLLCAGERSEVRLFLRKSRDGIGHSVYTESENALACRHLADESIFAIALKCCDRLRAAILYTPSRKDRVSGTPVWTEWPRSVQFPRLHQCKNALGGTLKDVAPQKR